MHLVSKATVVGSLALALAACGPRPPAPTSDAGADASPANAVHTAKKERLADAMRGLEFDSGRVTLEALAGTRTDLDAVMTADSELERGVRLLETVNDRTGAIAALSRSVVLDAAVPNTYVELGRAFVTRGMLAEAEASLRTALDLSPEHVDAQRWLAQTLQMSGDHEAANVEWARLVEIAPDDPDARTRLAIGLYFTGRLDEAWQQVHDAESQGHAVPGQFRALLERATSEPG